jgi:hypothetical protein
MADIIADSKLLSVFAARNADYYARAFDRQEREHRFFSLNLAALLAGPLWAAARRLWNLFWFGLLGELLALVLIIRALSGPDAVVPTSGLALFIFVRLAQSLAANAAYLRGVFPIELTLDHGGPICASTTDVALLLSL